MVVDHVVPKSKGGNTVLDNLCFACRRCNEYKGSQIATLDPLTGETTLLYHPRQHRWQDHFAWNEAATHLLGLTPIGRATISALNMNNPVIVTARVRWAGAGWHPPQT